MMDRKVAQASSSSSSAQGEYVKAWKLLGLNSRASLGQAEAAGRELCALTSQELGVRFASELEDGTFTSEDMRMACFFPAFAFAMLHHGHGFDLDRNFTAIETMDYQGTLLKVGWQLGAILYEINTLPWKYEPANFSAADPSPAMQAAPATQGTGSVAGQPGPCLAAPPAAAQAVGLSTAFAGALLAFAAGLALGARRSRPGGDKDHPAGPRESNNEEGASARREAGRGAGQGAAAQKDEEEEEEEGGLAALLSRPESRPLIAGLFQSGSQGSRRTGGSSQAAARRQLYEAVE